MRRRPLPAPPLLRYHARTMPKQTLSELQQRFSIPSIVRFEAGPGGLVRTIVDAPAAKAIIYVYGAHVAEYQPAGQAPVLFMSQKSACEPGKPLRGGVPLIFPWFGPRGGQAGAPLHGFVRTRDWTVESVQKDGDAVKLTFTLSDDTETRQAWDHPFTLRFEVTVGRQLDMALSVHNPSATPIAFEEALHTYCAVADVRQISITGLAGTTYIDKTDNLARKQQDASPLRIAAETDRVYLNTPAATTIDDPAGRRQLIIEKSGSNATVIWNPWTAKAKAMPDFGDDEWSAMICVETVNAADNAITLPAGQTHRMSARIQIS